VIRCSEGLFLCCLILNSALGAVIRVPAEQPTIQAGINAVSDYDTVLVADGTYTGSGNRDIRFYGRSVKLISENGPEVTIIDCQADPYDQHFGVKFDSGESTESLIDGFTVQNAEMDNDAGIWCHNSSPTIRNCILTGNGWYGLRCYAGASPHVENVTFMGNSGSGVAVTQSSPVFDNCYFGSGNLRGMSIHDSRPVVLNECTFSDCHSSYSGAAVYMEFDVTLRLTDCLFQNNSGGFIGGVIYGDLRDSVTMSGCAFKWNYSDYAGTVLHITEAPVIAENCVFEGNFASSTFTPMISLEQHCFGSRFTGCEFGNNQGKVIFAFDCGEIPIDSCIFTGNSSSSTTIDFALSPPMISNCTFTANRVHWLNGWSVITSDGTPVLENTVLAFNLNAPPLECQYPPDLYCCNFYGNGGGDWVLNYEDQLGVYGNISEDPQSCDVTNCHLMEISHCLPENNECGELIGALGWGCTTWMCGDCDSSEAVDIDDAVYIITYIFAGGSPPDPIEVGDANCSGGIDIDDVVYLIMYIFAAGPEPCAPCYE
jgi:hypothetical protein